MSEGLGWESVLVTIFSLALVAALVSLCFSLFTRKKAK
jgi:hypothetical protein